MYFIPKLPKMTISNDPDQAFSIIHNGQVMNPIPMHKFPSVNLAESKESAVTSIVVMICPTFPALVSKASKLMGFWPLVNRRFILLILVDGLSQGYNGIIGFVLHFEMS